MSVVDIKAEVPITFLLEHYGWIDNIDAWEGFSGRYQKCLCPFHDDHRPSAAVNVMDGRFKCWTCGVEGDIFDIVQDQEGMTFKEAKDWIVENFLSE